MVVPIPAGTEFSYNGIIFPVYSKSKVSEDPVWSGDGRVIKGSTITIEVSGIFTQADADYYAAVENAEGDPDNEGDPIELGATLDDFILFARRRLQVAGKRLAYRGRGFGTDLLVNDPAGLTDVAMGPRPGKFTWFSLGGMPNGCHAAGFSWSVSTTIAECGSYSNTPGPGVFLEVSCTPSYSIDEAGLLTLVTRAVVQIPLSLRGANTLIRNIDDVVSSTVKPMPDGFLRTVSRELSPDRATCRLNIVDKQIEVPFPPGVIHMEMTERIRQKARYGVAWGGSITGSVRMAPTVDKGLAWQAFMNIAAYRMAIARSNVTAGGPAAPGAGAGGGSNGFWGGVGQGVAGGGLLGGIVSGIFGGAANSNTGGSSSATEHAPNVISGTIEMSEKLFTNESSFTVNFDILGCPFQDIVQKSGLWRPIINPTDQPLGKPPPVGFAPWTVGQWSQSLRDSGSQTLKGLLGASFSTAGDIILDICNSAALGGNGIAQPPVTTATPDGILKEMEEDEDDDDENMSLSVLGVSDSNTDQFDPVTSWLTWECTPRRLVDHHIVRHKPLSGTVTYTTPPTDPLGPSEALAADTSNPSIGWSASVPDIVQQISSPSMVIRLTGGAVRLNWRINPPKMISYGGVPATLIYEDVSETVQGVQDATIYKTEWTLDYLIPAAPPGVPIVADPLLGTDGVGGAATGATGGLIMAH